MASKAVAVPEPEPEGVAAAAASVQAFLEEYVREELPEVAAGGDNAYKRMLFDILNAETVEDVLADTNVEDAALYVGRDLELHAFTPNQSKYESGGLYAILYVVTVDDNRKHVLSCGWQSVVAQCMKLELFNQYPYKIRISAARHANQFGNFPLRLVMAGEQNG